MKHFRTILALIVACLIGFTLGSLSKTHAQSYMAVTVTRAQEGMNAPLGATRVVGFSCTANYCYIATQ